MKTQIRYRSHSALFVFSIYVSNNNLTDSSKIFWNYALASFYLINLLDTVGNHFADSTCGEDTPCNVWLSFCSVSSSNQ